MEHPRLDSGGVYRGNWYGGDLPIRVINDNQGVVMYDAWRPDIDTWSLVRKPATCHFYRLPADFARERALHLRNEPLSQAEENYFRPELPNAFARFAGIQWSQSTPASPEKLAAILTESGIPLGGAEMRLQAASIHLIPFGPKGSQKKGLAVLAANGESFSIEEILWHAWHLQASHLRHDGAAPDGIGLYRSGLVSRTPAYYLWGGKSRLE